MRETRPPDTKSMTRCNTWPMKLLHSEITCKHPSELLLAQKQKTDRKHVPWSLADSRYLITCSQTIQSSSFSYKGGNWGNCLLLFLAGGALEQNFGCDFRWWRWSPKRHVKMKVRFMRSELQAQSALWRWETRLALTNLCRCSWSHVWNHKLIFTWGPYEHHWIRLHGYSGASGCWLLWSTQLPTEKAILGDLKKCILCFPLPTHQPPPPPPPPPLFSPLFFPFFFF